LLKCISATCLVTVLATGAMAQASGGANTSGTRAGPYGVNSAPQPMPPNRVNPPVPPNYNRRGANSPQDLPPVMGTQPNGNGHLAQPGYAPAPGSTPLSPGFNNTRTNNLRQPPMYAATNPPPNVTSFPFTNATGPFPNNPASPGNGMNPPQ